MAAKHLLIKGIVQGVFYRATAKEVAEKLGVSGWVKNTNEGHVEAMVTGADEALAKFIEWCRKGPPGAMVTALEIKEAGEETFDRFRIVREK